MKRVQIIIFLALSLNNTYAQFTENEFHNLFFELNNRWIIAEEGSSIEKEIADSLIQLTHIYFGDDITSDFDSFVNSIDQTEDAHIYFDSAISQIISRGYSPYKSLEILDQHFFIKEYTSSIDYKASATNSRIEIDDIVVQDENPAQENINSNCNSNISTNYADSLYIVWLTLDDSSSVLKEIEDQLTLEIGNLIGYPALDSFHDYLITESDSLKSLLYSDAVSSARKFSCQSISDRKIETILDYYGTLFFYKSDLPDTNEQGNLNSTKQEIKEANLSFPIFAFLQSTVNNQISTDGYGIIVNPSYTDTVTSDLTGWDYTITLNNTTTSSINVFYPDSLPLRNSLTRIFDFDSLEIKTPGNTVGFKKKNGKSYAIIPPGASLFLTWNYQVTLDNYLKNLGFLVFSNGNNQIITSDLKDDIYAFKHDADTKIEFASFPSIEINYNPKFYHIYPFIFAGIFISIVASLLFRIRDLDINTHRKIFNKELRQSVINLGIATLICVVAFFIKDQLNLFLPFPEIVFDNIGSYVFFGFFFATLIPYRNSGLFIIKLNKIEIPNNNDELENVED